MDGAPARADMELGGAPEGLDALIVADRIKAQGGTALFVARDYQRTGNFIQAFRFFAKDIEVLEYPSWDCLPYDRVSPNADVMARRIDALTRLTEPVAQGRLRLVITTVSAILQRVPKVDTLRNTALTLKIKTSLDRKAFDAFLSANGYTRAEQVMQVEKELFELYADPQLNTKPEQLSFRGGSFYSEVALELIRAIHNNLGTQLVVNTANRGAIHGLPDDAVIEINCIVDAQGAHPLTFGPLPEPMQALTQQVKAYERLTIEAAVHGDRRSGLLALPANPLVGNANLAQPLLDEVLTINAPYLPQFR